MGVVWLVFRVLPLLPIRFASQSNLCCRISKIDDRPIGKKKNTGLGVGPPLIWLWLSEVHVC